MEEDLDSYIEELQCSEVENIDYTILLSHMLEHHGDDKKYYMDTKKIFSKLPLEKVWKIRTVLEELGYEDASSEISKLYGTY
jgi:hypothetical protein